MSRAQPGERFGGRAPEVLNRSTIQALKRAEDAMLDAKARGHQLAVDVLDKYMHIFDKAASARRPMLGEDGKDTNPLGNKEDFEKYASMAVEAAKNLAKYQSPTFRAIVVAPPPPPPRGGDVDDDGTPRRRKFTLKIFEGGKEIKSMQAIPSPLAAPNGHGAGNGSGGVEITSPEAPQEE